ncbi:HNH endonuclease [Paenibacillus sp. sptzw28]|uniref:HNH endonuclease n=1 Tax=Paenibacillus sp. sptzw28 TaxID=715179 RepID=UPI001C6E620D|nr:HNH endonuclease signature motif containing protein [Paenibacillus sp. sptzw28]QYR20555.1 HNH endonuclease [Paenibacillus sp. sptzw28]
MNVKKCAVCGREKPLSAYTKRSGSTGRRGTCRSCTRKRQREAARGEAVPVAPLSGEEAMQAAKPGSEAKPKRKALLMGVSPVSDAAADANNEASADADAQEAGTMPAMQRLDDGKKPQRKRKRRRRGRSRSVKNRHGDNEANHKEGPAASGRDEQNPVLTTQADTQAGFAATGESRLQTVPETEGHPSAGSQTVSSMDLIRPVHPDNGTDIPRPKRKRKRRRRKQHKDRAKAHTTSVQHPPGEGVRKRPADKRIMPFKGPFTYDASVLNDRGSGMIRLRGRRDTSRRWSTEIPLEMAVRMVNEGAAGIINPGLIHKLYSKSDFRLLVLQRDNYICRYCGRFGDTIDHVMPKSKGGLSSPDNCVCACADCNLKKADSLDFTYDDFL